MRITPSAAPKPGFLAAIVLLCTPALLGAQTFDQVGERALGMGGAFTAVADDASAIYWNPAGLANIFKFDAELNLTSLHHPPGASDSPDSNRGALVGAALPMLGMAYYRVRTAALAPGSRQNEGSGQVQVSPVETGNFGVTLVQTLIDTVVVGSTLRAVSGPDATAFDLDLGGVASVGNIRMGVVARNLRKSLDIDRQVRVGVAWVPRSPSAGVYGPFSLAFDADLTRTPTPLGDQRQAAVGSEQWWAKGLVGTRLGVHWNTLKAADPAVSGGFSVKLTAKLLAEGHLTKGKVAGDSGWGIGARVTF